MKKYKVVQPEIIDPDAPLGNQEPLEGDFDVRDLVNIDDDYDRYMASPDDFPNVGEIVTEKDFYLKKAMYDDHQGVHSGHFAFRKTK